MTNEIGLCLLIVVSQNYPYHYHPFFKAFKLISNLTNTFHE